MHHVDRSTPWDEMWEAMTVLRQQGKIVYSGSSNFAGWQLVAAQEKAFDRHALGLVSEQSIYNLFTRWIELEVLPAAREYGIGVIPWSPLHGGLLAGVLQKQQDGSASRGSSGRAAEALAAHHSTIAEYEKFCGELGEHPAHVGLAWLLHQEGVTAPIIGPRTIEHLNETMRVLEIRLDDAALARLDQIFPPPGNGGPAPEAYAW